jgi:hypothetical protein
MNISGHTEIANWLLRGVLDDELAVDQYGETEHESIRRIGNVLLFSGDAAGGYDSAEVFADDAQAEAEFTQRLENMKAMESQARADWAESHP